MSEVVYVKFYDENYGYKVGDVVKAEVLKRDDQGIQVYMLSNELHDFGALITAWSDLGGFQELNGMEVLAHAASGAPFF